MESWVRNFELYPNYYFHRVPHMLSDIILHCIMTFPAIYCFSEKMENLHPSQIQQIITSLNKNQVASYYFAVPAQQ